MKSATQKNSISNIITIWSHDPEEPEEIRTQVGIFFNHQYVTSFADIS
jgi:hypothetical protein